MVFMSLSMRENFVDDDVLFAALDRYLTDQSRLDFGGQPILRRLADQNPRAVILVERLDPGAQVHRVTDDGVAHARHGADVAGGHLSRIDADPPLPRRAAELR